MSAARKPRRAIRPATGGVPQSGGAPDPTSDDLDLEVSGAPAGNRDEGEVDDEHSRWLREQRPPHWE